MNETIGNRIAKFRKAKSMTQENLAEKMGVSSQAVSKWETDTSCPDISLVPQLCKVLGVTADELLCGSEPEVRLVPKEQRKSLEELTMRIKVHSSAGDKVRVNLPMPLVKVGLEMGVEIGSGLTGIEGLGNIKMEQILELVEKGLIGKLVEVEDADGDTVEIVVE